MLYTSAQTVAVLFMVLLSKFSVHTLVNLATGIDPLATAELQFKLQFDLAKDGQLYTNKRNFIWSTHMTFATNLAIGDASQGKPAVTAGQMFKMGCDAWEEMKVNQAQYGLGTTANRDFYPPGMIGVMVAGNEIYISSTIKGPSYIYNLNIALHTEVHVALNRCRAVMHEVINPWNNPATNHQNLAGCAEPMLATQWYIRHDLEQNELLGDQVNTKTIAVRMSYTRDSSGETWGDCIITPPCGEFSNENWGCDAFTSAENMGPILTVTQEDYDLQALGLVTIDQLSICRSI